MRTIRHAAIILAALFLSFGHIRSSTFGQTQREPGSISGSVKLDGKPAKGITVIATASVSDTTSAALEIFNPSASLKAVTDSDGLYKLEGIPPGKYQVAPSTPALVSADTNKVITVSESATVEGVDFALTLGGVITGRVTDSDGRPVIGERITLKSLDSPNLPSISPTAMLGSRMYTTDDRGIYRIFGLRPGRYIVSAGNSNMVSPFLSQHPRSIPTFYSGVTEEARAKPVQIDVGTEASGVDIQFGATEKSFVVSGRVLDSENRTPIANAMVTYSKTQNGSTNDLLVSGEVSGIARGPGGFTTTNDKGEFRFAAVGPGRYKLEASSLGPLTGTGGSQFYADPLAFEVESTNVDKLDIKAHRGAGISGVVIVESADSRDSLDRYGQVVLMALVTDPATKAFSSANSVVGPDGSFRLGGLKPGRVTLQTISASARRVGILRIERSGVEFPAKFEIQDKEEITGLQVILTPAIGIIRGRVRIQGGTLPRGAEITASARPVNADPLDAGDFNNHSVEVSSDGSFIIENVTPGIYEVRVSSSLAGQSGSRVATTQTVTVSGNSPVEVELVLDLNRRDSDK